MHFFLAFTNPLAPIMDPIVELSKSILISLVGATHSLGWTLVIFAAGVKLVLWPLSQMQFKSMAEMQKVAPQVKKLQAQYKGDPQRMNQEVMALYKEHGVNPMAGCLPLVLQMPILFSLYYAIVSPQLDQYRQQGWLWIGSAVSHSLPNVFAIDLAKPDMVLLAFYVVSMYFSMRWATVTPADPAQAQQQKIMAFISPVMIAFIGRTWPSALILYWFSFNVFSTAQSYWLLRRYGMAGAAASTAPAPVTAKNVTPAREEAARANGKLPGPKSDSPSPTAPRKKRSRR